MLSTMWRFIYTKYWGILCWALCEDLFTQNTEEYFVEHCGKINLHTILIILYVKHCDKIYLHKLLRNTVCWALWEDLFTQNTGEYFLLNTVGIFIYIKYWEILYVEHWENWFTQNTRDYFMLNAVGRFIYTKYWGILYVERCGKIYLHKIPMNIVCWALWKDLFTQNTKEYCMLSTVGRFIYTKYWGILYVEHGGKILYTKYWGLLYVEHCGKIY